ncbi:alpha-D-ribose 1-methylphosphonate 5-triphosphate diphosphatase [Pseudooceanicola sp. LIPI14-2-Ac024]|uniref:alpha-D-ribose 1-methylphosphonate 5-triphosphate diphosphatase n=1 Tax=Pseudooceanicola sp. LIPI14-2-Ac024 TaxID=3344875 RepID=UPI0035CF31B7
MLPDLHITGAEVLRPEGIDRAPLGVASGMIVEGAPGRAVDLPGWTVLPGIVDIHGDGFERHLAPRRGAVRDLRTGLVSLEAELAANGITTAVLAQFWSWEGGMRGPEFAVAMLEAVEGAQARFATALLPQLRVETHLVDDYARIEEVVDRFGVPYVVFNDHLPHAALAAGKKVPRLTGQALKSGRSPEAHLALIEALHARGPEVPAAVAALAARLAARGVVLGSHDDVDAAARDGWRARGVAISEFPESWAAVEAAAGAGDPVIMGAPNVMRGGSHAGKISAGDVVRAGQCRALASDYHYPAPRIAALALAGEIGLEAAWHLVSTGPAEVLGLADRGALAAGMRADLVVLERESGTVGAVIAGGEVRYCAGEVARAFFG